MTAGSYFWRPAYVTHGPFFTTNGFIALAWADSAVVNHFIDDPTRTPEQNRREAEQLAPPEDYLTSIAHARGGSGAQGTDT
jgi:hypothetical protein